MIFYFSGVGNSAWVARHLAERLQDNVLSVAEEINKGINYVAKPGEKVGFVFPVYDGNLLKLYLILWVKCR